MIYFKPNQFWFVVLLIVPTLCQFEVGWGLYRWVDNHQSLFQPILDKKIVLSHPVYQGLSVQIETDTKITQQFNNYNLSLYGVEPNGQLMIQCEGKDLQVAIRNVSHFTIDIKCRQNQCKEEVQKIREQVEKNKKFNDSCKSLKGYYQCNSLTKTIVFSINLHFQKKQVKKDNNLETNKKYHKQNIKNFMVKQGIKESSINNQMVESAIRSLLNSICVYKYDDQLYLGFCQIIHNRKNKEWVYNIRLAAYSIFLLGDYYYNLAYAIYKDYFTVVESQLLYPTDQRSEVLPLPEHVEVFTRFGTIMEQQRQSQLLNSFIVIPMMNQLGTLHEQLNYREAKKLHPLLLKMISQKWSSSSPIKALKSIYQQSFTQDFKYHNYGQKMEQSIGKIAWIYKVIRLFSGILIKHHLHYIPIEQIKEFLSQHFSLRKIYEVYTNDDHYAKQGKYSNIIDAGEDLKLYSEYFGYDSLLVYANGLGFEFPESILKQLQTTIGIKSSNQKKYEKNYRYRGDIHTYFNLKIIDGLILQVQGNSTMEEGRKKQINENLNKLGKAVGNKIVDEFNKNQVIYTSWNPAGKGKEKCNWGQIVSILFLKWI